jgi:acetolactate synthase small subunit
MTHNHKTTMTLYVTVRQSITVLPRCLQILSRRGYKLLDLTTEPIDDSVARLKMVVEGYSSWHDALPHLLHRIVEVDEVTVEPEADHA